MSGKDKNDANENTSIDTPISDGEVPQKQSVVARFLEGFITDMAGLCAIDAGFLALTIKESKIRKKDVLGTLAFNTTLSTLGGLYDGHKAAEHNKHIDNLIKQKTDNHTQRIGQEKLTSSQSLQERSRV